MSSNTEKASYKDILKLAFPIALENLVSLSATVIDSLRSGAFGEEAVGGIYASNQIVTLLVILLTGIEMTACLMISREYGKVDGTGSKNESRASSGFGTPELGNIGELFLIGLISSLSLSLIFTVSGLVFPRAIVGIFSGSAGSSSGSRYLSIISLSHLPYALSRLACAALRGVGRARIGAYSSLCGICVKLIIGGIFISRFGISAMAFSTVACRLTELLVTGIFTAVYFKKNNLNLFGKICVKKRNILNFAKYGLQIMGSQAVWSINILGAGAIFGSIENKATIAAVGIAGVANTLALALISATSAAIGIKVSQAVGKGRSSHKSSSPRESSPQAVSDAATEYRLITRNIALPLGAAVALLLLALAPAIISFYDVGPEVRTEARYLIMILAALAPFTAYQSLSLGGYLRNLGKVGFVLAQDSFSVLVFNLPLALAARRLGAPFYLIFLLSKSDQIIKCAPAALALRSHRALKVPRLRRRRGLG